MKGRKTGGRLPGTPNRITANIRTAIVTALESEAAELIQLLQCLEPRDRIAAFIKLSALVVPPANTPEPDEPISEIRVHVIPSDIPLASCEADIVP